MSEKTPMPFLRLPNWLRVLALLTGATLLVAASPAQQKPGHLAAQRGNWINTIKTTSDGAHILGNPNAKIKLTEYISYTCPHCAHFNEQAQGQLALFFIGSGKGSVEIRPYIRNPVDLAAALLVNCGDANRFVRLHQIFLHTQAQWMARYAATNEGQRARWENGPMGSRMRAIASDLDFYPILENSGFTRPEIDHCLSDDAAMQHLAEQTQAATQAGVDGTPGFAIDGAVLTGTYDWKMLEPQLQARM
jgi:protein-disulfide isomerase